MIKHVATAALICAIQFNSLAQAEEALDPELLFKEAMELRNSGQVFSAIEIFETIISQQPGLNRARLELAVAYHQALQYKDAKDQLTKVLNDPETPETVKLAVTGYLAQLGSDEKSATQRTSSSVYVSAGFFNDSNVNLGPSAELNSSLIEKSGGGIIAMASFSHVSRSSKPMRSKDSLIEFEWNSQISVYDKSYTSSTESDFNLQVASLSTGPALVSGGNWNLQFNIKIDKVFFGGNPYSFNLGFNPKLTLEFDDDLQIFAETLTTVREFSNSSDQGLDGTSNMYAVGASKLFKGQTGIDGGLRYHSNGAEDSDLNASGIEIYLGAQTSAWSNARAYIELNSRQYDYETSQTAIIRDETEQRFVLGLSHDFKSSLLKDWTLNAQITHTENDSNDPNFKYDRDVIEANLRRYF
jgi:tetratricopeptide (TPR) repeat protein